MKKFSNYFIAGLLAMFFVPLAKAQIELPRPSPRGVVIQDVGLTEVKVEYFRPKMKGRKIFGPGDEYLVPFDQLWRTGANSGTKLSFDKNITFDGQELEAGEYLILTKPGKDQWEVIAYKDASIGGNMNALKEENVAARAVVKPEKLTETVKTFTINISDLSEFTRTANLQLAWENTSVKVPIDADYDEEVMAAIESATTVNVNNYVAAANYYYNTDRDLDQALEWVNLYLKENPNAFWHIHLKAQILAKLGKKKEAIETAKESIQKAKNNDGGDFGYIKRNEDLIADLN